MLRGLRYLRSNDRIHQRLRAFVQDRLPYLDYKQTGSWYHNVIPRLDRNARAFLGCNDRYFLLTGILRRKDAMHPWLFDRCREVEAEPDGHIDLWARFHYKSTIITFAGAIQEIMCDPDITIAIFSAVKPIAQEFLAQIKEEFENNEVLKRTYNDVLYADPKKKDAVEGRPAKWGVMRGITVKRKNNPKEATVEAHGLLDGQPTSRHFRLHIYDDMVTQDYLGEDQIKKTTERWEMADNLGSHEGVRKWMPGTRYHFADTYSEIIRRKALRTRIYPATDDGKLTGKPIFLTSDRWNEIKNTQRSTVSAQMLLNPIAGNEATFKPEWLRTYDVIPSIMNVYVTCDPSKGITNQGNKPDRTAIAVIGLDQAGNRYLLDGVRHRMKLSDRWKWLKHFQDKWSYHPGVQMVKVGYEQYGMVNDLEVIEEYMQRENNYFVIEELKTPRKTARSKNDRIERLEPDIRRGIFYFPSVVYHPEFVVQSHGRSLWRVWSEEDAKAYQEKTGKRSEYNVGEIIYRPLVKLTKKMEAAGETRMVRAVTRKDEHNNVYDVTRAFIEEYLPHPFGQHDDFLDAMARFYDLEPLAPKVYERSVLESIDPDSSVALEIMDDEYAEAG